MVNYNYKKYSIFCIFCLSISDNVQFEVSNLKLEIIHGEVAHYHAFLKTDKIRIKLLTNINIYVFAACDLFFDYLQFIEIK